MVDIVSSCEKDGQQGSETEMRECDESRPSRSLLPGHETNPPYLCHLSVSGCHWKGTYWTPSPLSLSFSPHCSFLFPSFTFSPSLDFSWLYSDSLHSLRVKEQKDWLVCLLWRKQGKRGVRGNMVKMENLRCGASDKLCTWYKNDSSCKHINMEIFSGAHKIRWDLYLTNVYLFKFHNNS